MMQKETSHHNSQMGKRQSHQTGLVTEVAVSEVFSPYRQTAPIKYLQFALGFAVTVLLRNKHNDGTGNVPEQMEDYCKKLK